MCCTSLLLPSIERLTARFVMVLLFKVTNELTLLSRDKDALIIFKETLDMRFS